MADRALRAAVRLGYAVLPVTSSDYPTVLRQIIDPPIVLWIRGDPGALQTQAVAIVGSRAASPTSLAVARSLARGLASAGLTTVSGMARGVDGAAHQGALEGGGRTIAVLGSGVDVPYPPEHEGLAERIAQAGAVISEFPPGTHPSARHFPLRNRVISGLSLAVVVVEASDKSGSLITARAALEQGRDVLAVPGNPLSGRHRGGHALIRDGARLVETVEDILEEVGWGLKSVPGERPAKSFSRDDLQSMMVSGDIYSVDDLAERSGKPAPEVLAELTELELGGRVARTEGGGFLKLD